MAKVKKFDILTVPLKIEFSHPMLQMLFRLWACLILVRIKKFNITTDKGKTVCEFYHLIVPRFMKGGASCEE